MTGRASNPECRSGHGAHLWCRCQRQTPRHLMSGRLLNGTTSISCYQPKLTSVDRTALLDHKFLQQWHRRCLQQKLAQHLQQYLQVQSLFIKLRLHVLMKGNYTACQLCRAVAQPANCEGQLHSLPTVFDRTLGMGPQWTICLLS